MRSERLIERLFSYPGTTPKSRIQSQGDKEETGSDDWDYQIENAANRTVLINDIKDKKPSHPAAKKALVTFPALAMNCS